MAGEDLVCVAVELRATGIEQRPHLRLAARRAQVAPAVDDVGFVTAYTFKYSPRPGTPAATMADQIAPEVMDDRLQRLQALINRQQRAFNEASVGKRTSILLERKGKLPGQLIGKSPWLQSVHVFAEAAVIGDLIEVDLVSAGANSLAGDLVQKDYHVA